MLKWLKECIRFYTDNNEEVFEMSCEDCKNYEKKETKLESLFEKLKDVYCRIEHMENISHKEKSPSHYEYIADDKEIIKKLKEEIIKEITSDAQNRTC